jgi:hypothetical protein
MSIPKNLVALRSSFLYPFMTDTTNKNIDGKVLGTLCLKFNNAIAAFSYLLFILLYCPCISVLAMITKELGIKWAGFVVAWTTGLAYIIAVAFYQTFAQSNVFANIVCGISSVFIFLGFTYLVKIFVYKRQVFHQTRLIPSKVV